MKFQNKKQIIDIAKWPVEEQFNPYPVGARDKNLVVSPSKLQCKIFEPRFLKANFRYLYKQSINRYPEQFWVEIFCYRFGTLLNIPVPPAHVAYNSNTGTHAALIEWFLKENVVSQQVHDSDFYFSIKKFFYKTLLSKFLYMDIFTPGGDLLHRLIHGYDRKRGEQHNFETIARLCDALLEPDKNNETWVKYWIRTFVFDVLIGNTDRHQENWGFISRVQNNKSTRKLTPVFDNGTSMGHEIFERNFFKFDELTHIERYIKRGTHHMKWKLSDTEKTSHLDFILLLINKYPESKIWIKEVLDFSMEDVRKILLGLMEFDIRTPLTEKRSNFMLKLISSRKEMLTTKIHES